MKRLQNRIAESSLLLPLMMLWAVAVWGLTGLLAEHQWPQFILFGLSAYMMVELSNGNALLRVRSRMVSSVFIALSCMICFLFGSLPGGLFQTFAIASLLLLLTTYQDPLALGRTYYAFLLIGLATMIYPQFVLLLPVIWLLMATQLQSLSWRSWMASLLGLLTPYWFAGLWLLWQRDLTPLHSLTSRFCNISFPPDFSLLTVAHWVTLALVTLLTMAGMLHFWRNSYEDKIRIRLLYGLFTWMATLCLTLTVLQPKLFDPLMRLAIIFASPLVAHLLTLTSSRLSNNIFKAVVTLVVLATAYALWTSSLLF